MSPVTSRVEPSGRVLIPAAVRRQLGIAPGDELIVSEEDGVIRLLTRAAAIKEAQRYFAQFANSTSATDELFAMRRAEVERENS